jgi:hypothetical protein
MSNFARPFSGKSRAQQAEGSERQIAENEQRFGQEVFQQTSGLRSSTVDTLQQVLAGGRPANMSVFAPEREAVERQYGRARENIIATTPARGGQLNRMLTDADLARAGTLGALEADIRRNAFNQSLSLGFGAGPAIGLGAYDSSSRIFDAVANRGDQGAKGASSGAGSLAGLGAGAAVALICWIAAALYGKDTVSFHLARRWIVHQWRGPLATITRWLYRCYGERLARHRWLVELLRPLFDRAVQNARAARVW